MKITTLFPALGVKNYRVFWITQWIALIGFWLQLTTQQWLVYKMTDSAFLLGLLSACQFPPFYSHWERGFGSIITTREKY